jgi:hypothetical protein
VQSRAPSNCLYRYVCSVPTGQIQQLFLAALGKGKSRAADSNASCGDRQTTAANRVSVRYEIKTNNPKAVSFMDAALGFFIWPLQSVLACLHENGEFNSEVQQIIERILVRRSDNLVTSKVCQFIGGISGIVAVE